MKVKTIILCSYSSRPSSAGSAVASAAVEAARRSRRSDGCYRCYAPSAEEIYSHSPWTDGVGVPPPAAVGDQQEHSPGEIVKVADLAVDPAVDPVGPSDPAVD